MNKPIPAIQEERIAKLRKDFVEWRKNYLKPYLAKGYGTPGGETC